MYVKFFSDENFLNFIIFSDERVTHLSKKVKNENARMLGNENSHRTIEKSQNSPK